MEVQGSRAVPHRRGTAIPRLLEVTMALCVEMLISGKLAENDADARAKLQAVLDNGKNRRSLWPDGGGAKGPQRFRGKLR